MLRSRRNSTSLHSAGGAILSGFSATSSSLERENERYNSVEVEPLSSSALALISSYRNRDLGLPMGLSTTTTTGSSVAREKEEYEIQEGIDPSIGVDSRSRRHRKNLLNNANTNANHLNSNRVFRPIVASSVSASSPNPISQSSLPPAPLSSSTDATLHSSLSTNASTGASSSLIDAIHAMNSHGGSGSSSVTSPSTSISVNSSYDDQPQVMYSEGETSPRTQSTSHFQSQSQSQSQPVSMHPIGKRRSVTYTTDNNYIHTPRNRGKVQYLHEDENGGETALPPTSIVTHGRRKATQPLTSTTSISSSSSSSSSSHPPLFSPSYSNQLSRSSPPPPSSSSSHSVFDKLPPSSTLSHISSSNPLASSISSDTYEDDFEDPTTFSSGIADYERLTEELDTFTKNHLSMGPSSSSSSSSRANCSSPSANSHPYTYSSPSIRASGLTTHPFPSSSTAPTSTSSLSVHTSQYPSSPSYEIYSPSPINHPIEPTTPISLRSPPTHHTSSSSSITTTATAAANPSSNAITNKVNLWLPLADSSSTASRFDPSAPLTRLKFEEGEDTFDFNSPSYNSKGGNSNGISYGNGQKSSRGKPPHLRTFSVSEAAEATDRPTPLPGFQSSSATENSLTVESPSAARIAARNAQLVDRTRSAPLRPAHLKNPTSLESSPSSSPPNDSETLSPFLFPPSSLSSSSSSSSTDRPPTFGTRGHSDDTAEADEEGDTVENAPATERGFIASKLANLKLKRRNIRAASAAVRIATSLAMNHNNGNGNGNIEKEQGETSVNTRPASHIIRTSRRDSEYDSSSEPNSATYSSSSTNGSGNPSLYDKYEREPSFSGRESANGSPVIENYSGLDGIAPLPTAAALDTLTRRRRQQQQQQQQQGNGTGTIHAAPVPLHPSTNKRISLSGLSSSSSSSSPTEGVKPRPLGFSVNPSTTTNGTSSSSMSSSSTSGISNSTSTSRGAPTAFRQLSIERRVSGSSTTASLSSPSLSLSTPYSDFDSERDSRESNRDRGGGGGGEEGNKGYAEEDELAAEADEGDDTYGALNGTSFISKKAPFIHSNSFSTRSRVNNGAVPTTSSGARVRSGRAQSLIASSSSSSSSSFSTSSTSSTSSTLPPTTTTPSSSSTPVSSSSSLSLSDSSEVTYLRSSSFKPCDSPDAEYRSALKALKASDWSIRFQGINSLRRVAVKHSEILHPHLRPLLRDLRIEVDSLRSSLAKNAILCLADLFEYGAGKVLQEVELESVVPSLLKRAGEASGFLAEEAQRALTCMCYHCVDIRSLNVLLNSSQQGTKVVKTVSCGYIDKLLEIHGTKLIQGGGNRDMSKLYKAVGSFASDAAASSRQYSKMSLLRLGRIMGLDKLAIMMKQLLPPAHFHAVKKVLDKGLEQEVMNTTSAFSPGPMGTGTGMGMGIGMGGGLTSPHVLMSPITNGNGIVPSAHAFSFDSTSTGMNGNSTGPTNRSPPSAGLTRPARTRRTNSTSQRPESVKTTSFSSSSSSSSSSSTGTESMRGNSNKNMFDDDAIPSSFFSSSTPSFSSSTPLSLLLFTMSTPEARRDAIIAAWKAKSDKLNLTEDQEAKIKVWFGNVFAAIQSRRADVKGKVTELAGAADESAKAAILTSIRQSLRESAANREKALDEFDTILNPTQRASIVLYVAKKAAENKKEIDNLFDILADTE